MHVYPLLLLLALGAVATGCASRQQDTASVGSAAVREQAPRPPQRQPEPAPAPRTPAPQPAPKQREAPDHRETGQAKASPPAVTGRSDETPPESAPAPPPGQEPAAKEPAQTETPDRVAATAQSESADDVTTTARIRQALLGDDQLSFRAKNILVVTSGEQVVLQGPVANQSEAERIRTIAGRLTTRHIEDRLSIPQE